MKKNNKNSQNTSSGRQKAKRVSGKFLIRNIAPQKSKLKHTHSIEQPHQAAPLFQLSHHNNDSDTDTNPTNTD